MSELVRRAEVPVATTKYYLREGLLHPGSRTAPNQAEYDASHLHRLRLIRVLVEVGGLEIAQVRAVVEALDDPAVSTHRLLGLAHYAIGSRSGGRASPEDTPERGEVDLLLEELGWQVTPDAPGRAELAAALAGLRRVGWEATADRFRPYADAAFALAEHEVGAVSDEPSRAETVERAIVGTVVFEKALVALRRLALEHHSKTFFAR